MNRLLLALPAGMMVFAFSGSVLAYHGYESQNAYYDSDYGDSTPRAVTHTNKKEAKKVKTITAVDHSYGKNYMGGRNVFVFDPRSHSWSAYSDGHLVKSGRASGGKSYCPDIGRGCKTIVGTYHVISKGGANCKSSRFPVETRGGAPMPWCMRFHAKGYAVHGSNDVPNYNASHGCVRVTPADASWLSHNFMGIGTTVIVRPY
jgi:hypothetical protein